ISLIPDAVTPHEGAVYTNIASLEPAHAESCSQTFSPLASTTQIDETFSWGATNEQPQKEAQIIGSYYESDDREKRRAAARQRESLPFHSGCYLPMRYSSHGELTNPADIIRLIIRDEAVHGYYIGYKYQKAVEKLSAERRAELKEYTFSLLLELYENERKSVV